VGVRYADLAYHMNSSVSKIYNSGKNNSTSISLCFSCQNKETKAFYEFQRTKSYHNTENKRNLFQISSGWAGQEQGGQGMGTK
jgi:hypothetical protein